MAAAAAEPADQASPGTKLRFGVMCSGLELPHWQAQCVRSLVESGVAKPVLLIVEDGAANTPGRWRYLRKIDNVLFMLYNRILIRPRVHAYKKCRLDDILGGLDRIICTVEERGHSQYFRTEDLARIRDHDLDFILRFGFKIIRGPILHLPRYGVWSYHHGDEQSFRGTPAGFWELYYDRPHTGVLLQRLGERLDNGTVLVKGRFRTALTYRANLDRIYLESLTWPRQCAERIARGDTAFLLARPPPSTARIFRPPTNAEFLRFVVRQGKRVLARVLRAGFYADDWNIGVAAIDRRRLIEGWRATAVDWAEPDPAGRQLADPMVLEREGGATIFAEQFDYAGPGRIVALDWPERFAAELALVELQSSSHISYPFVFAHENESWMIPETRSVKRLSLWRREPSGGWKEARRLAEDVSLTDPTLVFRDGRWWLFCCDGAGLPDTRLLIYFADDLFGPWRGHPLNPVKFDVRSARPAGPLFEVDEVLYRPAQDCASTYGGAITINRVESLSPERFEEVPVATVEPDPGSAFPDGVHTLVVGDRRVYIDGKRTRLRTDLVLTQLRRRLARRRPVATPPPPVGFAAPGWAMTHQVRS